MESKTRKAFNFYKSYFDVYNELNNKDKLLFIDALLNRQFYGLEPDLKGIVSFAYISQKHSIDKQIKGFEDKTGSKLTPPTVGPYVGGSVGPSVQEKEKEKEKGEYTLSKHLFKNSPYYKKPFYLDEIKKTDFKIEKNIDFGSYWYSMDDWSSQNGHMKKDWLATARSWIRKDIKEGKVKIEIEDRFKNGY